MWAVKDNFQIINNSRCNAGSSTLFLCGIFIELFQWNFFNIHWKYKGGPSIQDDEFKSLVITFYSFIPSFSMMQQAFSVWSACWLELELLLGEPFLSLEQNGSINLIEPFFLPCKYIDKITTQIPVNMNPFQLLVDSIGCFHNDLYQYPSNCKSRWNIWPTCSFG